MLGWVLGLFVIALLLPTFGEIGHVWSTHRYAAHGIFVPVLTVLVLWSRRQRLTAPAHGSATGLVVVSLALVFAAIGHAKQSVLAHVLAVVGAAIGIALCVRGIEWTRRAAAPLAFLGFMLPLPRELVSILTGPLQRFIAWLSAGFLEGFGIPVSRRGAVLDLPAATLQVDEGCNGLRFLMVLLIVTTAFALIHLSTYGKMVAVIGVAIPVAMLANVVRVTAIGVAVTWLTPEAGAGAFHDFIGRVVWVLATVVVLGVGVVLGRRERLAGGSALRRDGSFAPVAPRV